MRSIKTMLLLILALCMVFTLCACNNNTATPTTEPSNPSEPSQPTDPSEPTDPTGPVYKITVVDENQNPLSGVMIQMCQDSTCVPGVTDANGVKEYAVAEADYEVKIMKMPEGYSYSTSEQVFKFEDGSFEMIITLNSPNAPVLGTEENPYSEFLAEEPIASAEIAAGQAVYYNVYGAGGTILTINDEDAYVIYNGVTYNAVDGVVTVTIEPVMGRMPVAFQLGNNSAAAKSFSMTFTYPLGNASNPEVIETLGSLTTTIEAGNEFGYYYTWTATADGTFTVAVDTTATTGGWQYLVNNVTGSKYGDTHWSNDEPVVASESITVKTGDEIQIWVHTYDPANEFVAPAGSVVITVSMA